MNQYYIILVEPVYAGNVGAIARTMHNFNYQHLRIVGKIPEKNDYYLAVHSESILDDAKVYPTLVEAIADLDRVIAVSRRIAKIRPVDLSPELAAAYAHEGDNLKIGIVFGRETYGLTDEEADLCPLRCHIPANPDFPSLNLAQAATVLMYEIYSWSRRERRLQRQEAEEVLASGKDVNHTKDYILKVLDSIGFFREQEIYQWPLLLDNWLSRMNPTPEITHRLRQMFNRIHVACKGRGKGYKQS